MPSSRPLAEWIRPRPTPTRNRFEVLTRPEVLDKRTPPLSQPNVLDKRTSPLSIVPDVPLVTEITVPRVRRGRVKFSVKEECACCGDRELHPVSVESSRVAVPVDHVLDKNLAASVNDFMTGATKDDWGDDKDGKTIGATASSLRRIPPFAGFRRQYTVVDTVHQNISEILDADDDDKTKLAIRDELKQSQGKMAEEIQKVEPKMASIGSGVTTLPKHGRGDYTPPVETDGVRPDTMEGLGIVGSAKANDEPSGGHPLNKEPVNWKLSDGLTQSGHHAWPPGASRAPATVQGDEHGAVIPKSEQSDRSVSGAMGVRID